MAASPQFVNAPNIKGTKFTNSDTTSAKTIFTPGTAGARIENLVIVSNNTASTAVIISIVQSSVAYKIGRVVIPAVTGSVPLIVLNAIDVLPWIDLTTPGFIMANGTTLQANMETTLASTKELDIVVMGGDF